MRHWSGMTRAGTALQVAAYCPRGPGRSAMADGIHRLRALGVDAIHDRGRVHGTFHAFMLIDRSTARITLVMAAGGRAGRRPQAGAGPVSCEGGAGGGARIMPMRWSSAACAPGPSGSASGAVSEAVRRSSSQPR